VKPKVFFTERQVPATRRLILFYSTRLYYDIL
jgi:hypothetical protein